MFWTQRSWSQTCNQDQLTERFYHQSSFTLLLFIWEVSFKISLLVWKTHDGLSPSETSNLFNMRSQSASVSALIDEGWKLEVIGLLQSDAFILKSPAWGNQARWVPFIQSFSESFISVIIFLLSCASVSCLSFYCLFICSHILFASYLIGCFSLLSV